MRAAGGESTGRDRLVRCIMRMRRVAQGMIMNWAKTRAEWFGNIRGDVLSGIVVALALIPEAIAFSIIAGVDPKVGLYASFCIAIVIAFCDG